MTATTFSTPNGLVCTPSLAPLYFESRSTPSQEDDADAGADVAEAPPLETLPPELLHACLASYADWGDLAKLSSVRKSWKSVVEDAAAHGGPASRWELANLLLGIGLEKPSEKQCDDEDVDCTKADYSNDGVVGHKARLRGLAPNPTAAVRHLEVLTKVIAAEIEEEDEEEVDIEAAQAEDESDEDGSIYGRAAITADDTDSSSEDQYLAPAMRLLADCHLTGKGVPSSPQLGLRILRTSYRITGDVGAAHDLALIHEYSLHSVPIDIVRAFRWFRAAALGGHVGAMAELALCFELGCGVDRSDDDALEWYVRAAERGCASSQYSVGEIYEEARGVPQSDEEACLWYHRAVVSGGCEDARKALKRLEDIARIVLPGVGGILGN